MTNGEAVDGADGAQEASPGGLRLIVDTNVVQEFIALHDLLHAADRKTTEEILLSREVAYRKARTRDSVMFAWFCHLQRATTYIAAGETVSTLFRKAPPKNGDDWNASFVRAIIHFVKQRVLPGMPWPDKFPDEPDDLRGGEADNWLLSKAIIQGLPLITNEGNSIDGLSGSPKAKKKLRHRAHASDVAVYTPGEFLHLNHFDFPQEGREFLRAFDDAVPGYLEGRGDRKAAEELLGSLRWLYAYVLFDEVDEAFRNKPQATWPSPVGR